MSFLKCYSDTSTRWIFSFLLCKGVSDLTTHLLGSCANVGKLYLQLAFSFKQEEMSGGHHCCAVSHMINWLLSYLYSPTCELG